jgi:hypothetical protein
MANLIIDSKLLIYKDIIRLSTNRSWKRIGMGLVVGTARHSVIAGEKRLREGRWERRFDDGEMSRGFPARGPST